MENYKPNSYKSREAQKDALAEKPKVEKIVTGGVKTKKKSELSKVKDVFIAEDIDTIKNYIIMDVLVPAFKKAVSDIVRNGIDMLLYGEVGSEKRSSTASKVSYRSYYERNNDRSSGSRVKPTYGYDDIVLESRGEAEEVLDKLEELIETFKIASVADLYDLVGVSCDYTANNYGWTNLRSASVVRVRDGYLLKLPKAMPLN